MEISDQIMGMSKAFQQYIQGNVENQQAVQKYSQEKAIDAQYGTDEGVLTPEAGQSLFSQISPEFGQAAFTALTKNKQQTGKDMAIKDAVSLLSPVMKQLSDNAPDTEKENAKASQTLTKYQDMFNKASTKEKDAQDSTYTAMQQIADAGKNPVAASSVPITLARMMTGTSRINTVEIEKLGGTQAVLGHLNQIAQTMAQGTLTSENQQYMTHLAQVLHDSHQTNVEQTGIDHAKQYMRVSRKDLPTAYSDLTGRDYPKTRHPKTGELLPQEAIPTTPTDIESKKAALRAKLGL